MTAAGAAPPRVALTQSDGRLEGLGTSLRNRGYDVVRVPLIETVVRTDPATADAAAAMLELPWVLFTSRTTVEAWRTYGLPFAGPRFGAVGEKTAAALARAGADVSLVARPATAEGLARTFVSRRDAAGPVGLPHGNRARPVLRAALERAGFQVRAATVYDTVSRPWTVEGPVDAIVLASPSAFASVPAHVAERARLITLGPTTSRAVRASGHRPFEATRPSVEAILETLSGEGTP